MFDHSEQIANVFIRWEMRKSISLITPDPSSISPLIYEMSGVGSDHIVGPDLFKEKNGSKIEE